METDYKDCDKLFVAVKLNKLGEVDRCYRALGWECVESRDDLVHRGRVHLTYRRPHRVENKDELQLLQVYLESAMNDEGRLERRAMPKTAAVAVILGIFTLALAIAGLCLVFLNYFKDKPLYYTSGMIILACAGAAFLLAIIATLTVFFNERERRREKLETAHAEIFAALKEAERICGNGCLSEAAVALEGGSDLNGAEGGDER